MIKYINGNILLALEKGELDVIAHGCNCQGGFGSGIAGQIARRWPHVRDAYINLHNNGGTILGFFQPVPISDNQYIINCGTQDKYLPRGVRHADYDAINDVLESLSLYTQRKLTRVGIPKIGAGLAGGDWEEIEKIILKHFTDQELTVYIYP